MRPWNILWGRSQIMLIDNHLIKEGKLWLQITNIALFFNACPPPSKVSKICLQDLRSKDPLDYTPPPPHPNGFFFALAEIRIPLPFMWSPVWYSLFCVILCYTFCHTMNLLRHTKFLTKIFPPVRRNCNVLCHRRFEQLQLKWFKETGP